jgi:hypothetical protein
MTPVCLYELITSDLLVFESLQCIVQGVPPGIKGIDKDAIHVKEDRTRSKLHGLGAAVPGSGTKRFSQHHGLNRKKQMSLLDERTPYLIAEKKSDD